LKYYRLNNRITAPKVRLIGEKGEHLGIVETSSALQLAREKELDLVEIGPKADPPVAKIIDFGQFKYDLKKKGGGQKAKQKAGGIKGIRLTPRMAQHDLGLRVKRAKEFLKEGKKIKIEMVLRGREKAHFDLARDLINRFITELGQDIKIEQPVQKQGGRLTVIVGK